MASSEKKSCTYEDKIYSHESEVCEEKNCIICNDGIWEERVEIFPPRKSDRPS